ncbi:hypothetical protein [Flavobacterium sp. N1736]|uniref:hypothetical protein n=1 Tax=Flavobacterium sp. N1736 TaxID=2986823 RepID=UPI002224B9E7|nr:hypothetical protein [Flavobacterium sp. N1736]
MNTKIKFIFIVLLFCSCTKKEFFGYVYDYDTEEPIENVHIDINGKTTKTDSVGYFCMKIKSNSPCKIVLKKESYAVKKIYRKPDSLGEFSNKSLKGNKIYLYTKESDFSNKRR